jgi:two-component system, OmpR family, sensor kinase
VRRVPLRIGPLRIGALSRIGSLKNKLALLFFAIVALAFAAIFALVIPQLRSSLEAEKVKDLGRVASASSGPLQAAINEEIPAREVDELVRSVADGSDARVTLLGALRSGETAGDFYVISDSGTESRVDLNPSLTLAATRTGRVTTEATVARGDKLAQAAKPLEFRGRPAWVALYTRNLADVTETVSLIRNRLLGATALALLVSLAGGYLIAQALARRVRRLEEGAEQVAAGNFIDPLPVDSDDELGRLTHTFNEMQRQLSRVDRARKEFIANASHELRTPIFSLGGFVELLQDEELDEATRQEFLTTMREQVDRLQKLAVHLLDLSRLDAGSLQLQRQHVNLAELARDVVGEFAPAAAQHAADLDLKLPESGVQAVCDEERVAQIMRILIDNALVHTPGGTQVVVRAERRNGTARLTVSDSGPGVAVTPQRQVFERFYTADGAGGSGLGLAIADELARRMDGSIALDSRPGKTVFTLTLPMSDQGGPAR